VAESGRGRQQATHLIFNRGKRAPGRESPVREWRNVGGELPFHLKM